MVPVGKYLIYQKDEYPSSGLPGPGNRDLWIIKVTGGRPRQVTFATGRAE